METLNKQEKVSAYRTCVAITFHLYGSLKGYILEMDGDAPLEDMRTISANSIWITPYGFEFGDGIPFEIVMYQDNVKIIDRYMTCIHGVATCNEWIVSYAQAIAWLIERIQTPIVTSGNYNQVCPAVQHLERTL